jgi:hypothetical protein
LLVLLLLLQLVHRHGHGLLLLLECLLLLRIEHLQPSQQSWVKGSQHLQPSTYIVACTMQQGKRQPTERTAGGRPSR